MRRGWARDSVAHVQSNYKSLVNVGTTVEREQVGTARQRVGRHMHTSTCSRVEIKRIVKHKVLHHLFGMGGVKIIKIIKYISVYTTKKVHSMMK